MSRELQIVWRGLEPSAALSDRIRQHADGVEGPCRVTVAAPHRHHRHGERFEVKILAELPGRTVAVTRSPGDAWAAVNDAFERLFRRLDAHGPKRRAGLRHARVAAR